MGVNASNTIDTAGFMPALCYSLPPFLCQAGTAANSPAQACATQPLHNGVAVPHHVETLDRRRRKGDEEMGEGCLSPPPVT